MLTESAADQIADRIDGEHPYRTAAERPPHCPTWPRCAECEAARLPRLSLNLRVPPVSLSFDVVLPSKPMDNTTPSATTLTACTACGHRVAPNAGACPGCGLVRYPSWSAIGATLAAGVAIMCLSMGYALHNANVQSWGWWAVGAFVFCFLAKYATPTKRT